MSGPNPTNRESVSGDRPQGRESALRRASILGAATIRGRCSARDRDVDDDPDADQYRQHRRHEEDFRWRAHVQAFGWWRQKDPARLDSGSASGSVDRVTENYMPTVPSNGMRQPTVGTPPEYTVGDDQVPWVLGTQLTEQSGPLARAPKGSRVLLVEAHEFARRMPYHHNKLTLVFAAMRQFRDRLRAAGYDVTYVQADSFGDALTGFFEDNPGVTLVTMRSPSYGSERRFRELVEEAGGDLRVVENELFVSTRRAFDEWQTATSSDTSSSTAGCAGSRAY
jgi:hypothetical protein